MTAFLSSVLDAHGGQAAWDRFEKVEASIVSGGGLFPLKGLAQDSDPRRMAVWLKYERSSLAPYGASDQLTDFTRGRIAIEKTDGSLIAERRDPLAAFVGHGLTTPWDELDRAYFNGEALWTYLNTPFLLTLPGVEVDEIEPWNEGDETWRVLRAYLPGRIQSHCAVQDFFFGSEDGLLRRHDYRVDILGQIPAAQLTSDYVEADGIRLPTRRRAFARGPDRRPIPELLMVKMDLSEIHFS